MPYRVASPHKRQGFYFLLVAGAVAGIVALALALASNLRSNTLDISKNATITHAACMDVAKLQTVIHSVLVQSLKTFGQKGTAGYEYYRTHPTEYAAARLALQQEIRQFAGRVC